MRQAAVARLWWLTFTVSQPVVPTDAIEVRLALLVVQENPPLVGAAGLVHDKPQPLNVTADRTSQFIRLHHRRAAGRRAAAKPVAAEKAPHVEEAEIKGVPELAGPMPLRAPEQGFSGPDVIHVDGETHTADWLKEFTPEPHRATAPPPTHSPTSTTTRASATTVGTTRTPAGTATTSTAPSSKPTPPSADGAADATARDALPAGGPAAPGAPPRAAAAAPAAPGRSDTGSVVPEPILRPASGGAAAPELQRWGAAGDAAGPAAAAAAPQTPAAEPPGGGSPRAAAGERPTAPLPAPGAAAAAGAAAEPGRPAAEAATAGTPPQPAASGGGGAPPGGGAPAGAAERQGGAAAPEGLPARAAAQPAQPWGRETAEVPVANAPAPLARSGTTQPGQVQRTKQGTTRAPTELTTSTDGVSVVVPDTGYEVTLQRVTFALLITLLCAIFACLIVQCYNIVMQP